MTTEPNIGNAWRAILRAQGWYVVWEDEDGNLYQDRPWNEKPMSEQKARKTARQLTKRMTAAQAETERLGAGYVSPTRNSTLWWIVATLLVVGLVGLLLALVGGTQ